MKKYNHWQIAYREDMNKDFKLVQNPAWAWAADPFLVEYEDRIYLFAELFLYKSERNGVIGCCKYEDGKFGEWFVTMDCHWHLSYPNVWTEEGNLYMCPETYQTGEVAVYKLEAFPDRWRKIRVLLQNGKYVDSTFMKYGNKNYLFTYRLTNSSIAGNLLLYEIFPDGTLSKERFISDDIGSARPGGKVIVNEEKKVVRVSQDSANGYGAGLVFSEVESVNPVYREKKLLRVGPDEIIGNWNRSFTGVHTYNRFKNMEVIDLNYLTFSFSESIAQKRVRKVFTNKY